MSEQRDLFHVSPMHALGKVKGAPCAHGFKSLTKCEVCRKAYGRAWYRAKGDERKEAGRMKAKRYRSDPAKGPKIFASGRRAARDSYWRRVHGITVAERDAMIAAQNGLCAICMQPEDSVSPGPSHSAKGRTKTLSVDHDHALSGREAIRGMLCLRCNCAINRLELDPEWADKALAYLAAFAAKRRKQST